MASSYSVLSCDGVSVTEPPVATGSSVAIGAGVVVGSGADVAIGAGVLVAAGVGAEVAVASGAGSGVAVNAGTVVALGFGTTDLAVAGPTAPAVGLIAATVNSVVATGSDVASGTVVGADAAVGAPVAVCPTTRIGAADESSLPQATTVNIVNIATPTRRGRLSLNIIPVRLPSEYWPHIIRAQSCVVN